MNSEMQNLFGKVEDLAKELQDYTSFDPQFGTCIRHPLVYSVVHGPELNAFVNAQLQQKQRGLASALSEGNWYKYVYLHERPWRLDAFVEIQDRMDDEAYWELAGSIWVDSENIYQNIDTWRDIFEQTDRKSRKYFMSEADRNFFALSVNKGGLPPVFTVYRGFKFYEDDPDVCGEDGFSWTIDQQRAIWFARRFADDTTVPMLASGTISKTDVIGFMSGRGEQEIVCLPENVCAIELTMVGDGGVEA